MSTDAAPQAAPGHPAPHRHHARLAALLFGLAGGPIAWSVQLILVYALASYACDPAGLGRGQMLAPGTEHWPVLLTINIAAFVVALAAAAVSYRSWRATQREHPGEAGEAIEAGEGRTRFMALCGGLVGVGFALATGFNTVSLLMVPSCAAGTPGASVPPAASAGGPSASATGAFAADPLRGAQIIGERGCGACHAIPGIGGARGQVGPPLGDIGARTIIAGLLPNTPDNMVTWLRTPQAVVPGNAMPNTELDEHDAKDIAAYLDTLR